MGRNKARVARVTRTRRLLPFSPERPSLSQLQRPSNSARTRRDGPMALSKLSGDEQGILFVQLCNVKRRLRGENI